MSTKNYSPFDDSPEYHGSCAGTTTPSPAPQWAIRAAEEIIPLNDQFAPYKMLPMDEWQRRVIPAALCITKHAAEISEENERLKREVEELNRRLEEQHKLYCEETKRHNETWAKIHAATGYLNKEFKKLPEDLLDAVKEVVFRVTLVELGRNSLQGEVAELRDKRKKLIEKLRESVNDTRELNDLAEALVDERGALRQWSEQAREVLGFYAGRLRPDENGYEFEQETFTGERARALLQSHPAATNLTEEGK